MVHAATKRERVYRDCLAGFCSSFTWKGGSNARKRADNRIGFGEVIISCTGPDGISSFHFETEQISSKLSAGTIMANQRISTILRVTCQMLQGLMPMTGVSISDLS